MLALYDEATLLHETVELLGSRFEKSLECPQRIEEILNALRKDGLHDLQAIDATGKGSNEVYGIDSDPALLSKILRETHDAGYLDHLRTTHDEWVAEGLIEVHENVFPESFFVPGLAKPGVDRGPPKDRFARAGYYAFDMSSGLSKDTWVAALASANLAAVAARLTVLPEKDAEIRQQNVLALCRPPGHHCTTKLAGGYCYINNAVVAVQSLRYHSSQYLAGIESSQNRSPKVTILDLDFHHGNGTQSYFYDDPSVLYISIHGKDEYPYYSGYEDEVGENSGIGYNMNLPLASNSSIGDYIDKLELAIRRMQEFAPSHLIISLGFDTFYLDPLGRFDIKTEDYELIARKIRCADGLRNIPSLILLEGGYVLDKLGENLLRFLMGWERS